MISEDQLELAWARLRAVGGCPDRHIHDWMLNGCEAVTDSTATFADYYRSEPYADFVYDLRTGLFFLRLMGVSHEEMMSQLYEYHTSDLSQGYAAAELYVNRGLGIFRSSVSTRVHVGFNTVVPAEIGMVIRRDIRRM